MMNLLTLDAANHDLLASWLHDERWLVACLCARWCDQCEAYRTNFATLAARHPGKHFVWIDIEDQADLVGDMEVENFPTLLIQRSAVVAFFGAVLPDVGVADRIISSLARMGGEELQLAAQATPSMRAWQTGNLLKL